MSLTPLDVLHEWFAAHSAGDLAKARGLMSADAAVTMPGARLQGFDAFMAWYAERLAAEPGFSYELVDLLAGERHAAAVLHLRSGTAQWRQLALYEVEDGRIIGMWAAEDR